ncbi:30343_t:CDS:2, partial [Racocetra persica]
TLLVNFHWKKGSNSDAYDRLKLNEIEKKTKEPKDIKRLADTVT